MTLPEFPAEIRAPTGTTFGVSAYQVQFGTGEVLTPGDEADVLVAFNPAAFVTNIQFLKPGGTVVYDEGAFNERAFMKAGLTGTPVDDSGAAPYRTIPIAVTQRTLEAVAEFGLGRKDGSRAKNFWALGLSLWLCGQSPDATIAWIERRFAKTPALLGGNLAALKAGYAYGETMELALPEVVEIKARKSRSARTRMASGTEAMALGVAAAGALAERPVFYCSYPITPASALLHALAKLKAGVKTFQAEDEIAAVCAAIGASYAGGLGFTASSGPGLSLKTEALGLAITAELPLVVIDMQRAGPSTGMPTKPEQSDLDMAVFGRHGESPLAGARAGDAGRLLRHRHRRGADRDRGDDAGHRALRRLSRQRHQRMGAAGDRRASRLRPQCVRERRRADHRLHARSGDARPAVDRAGHARWPPPHRRHGEGRDHRQHLLRPRQPRRDGAASRREDRAASPTATTRALIHEGPEEGDLLVIGWGSTFGPIRQAVRNLAASRPAVAHLHLRQLWPLPAGLEAILKRYKKIVCAEMNTGQLASILRSTYLLPVEPVTQISGRPFLVSTLEEAFSARLKGRMQ